MPESRADDRLLGTTAVRQRTARRTIDPLVIMPLRAPERNFLTMEVDSRGHGVVARDIHFPYEAEGFPL